MPYALISVLRGSGNPNEEIKDDDSTSCFGHTYLIEETIFTMDGWALAFHIQKRYEQGDAPVYE